MSSSYLVKYVYFRQIFSRKYEETGGQIISFTAFDEGQTYPKCQYLPARQHGVTS